MPKGRRREKGKGGRGNGAGKKNIQRERVRVFFLPRFRVGKKSDDGLFRESEVDQTQLDLRGGMNHLPTGLFKLTSVTNSALNM